MAIEAKLLTLVELDEDIVTDALNFYKVPRLSIQATIEGAPVGSLKIQCSNDLTKDGNLVSNWVDYADSTVAVSGPVQIMYNLKDISFKWIRLSYTFTSGTGLISSSAHSTRDV